MPDASVAANLSEALDVKVNPFSKFTLNPILPVNKLTEAVNLILGKVTYLDIRIDASLS
jgi:hypothetical protein